MYTIGTPLNIQGSLKENICGKAIKLLFDRTLSRPWISLNES